MQPHSNRDQHSLIKSMKPHALVAAGLLASLATSAFAATLTPVEFNPVGIPYGWDLSLDEADTAETAPDHVGAWSWDEDNFPATTRGWTHTSKWVKLNLLKPAQFTLTLQNREGVVWPSAEDANRLAGTNLFPSFSLYRGWDTDAGLLKLPDGTTLDQDHTFNNRGNIEWAEDVTYLDHLDNGTTHSVTRTWVLPAGQYTLNLGGNSPAALAEGRQGYTATFVTQPVAESLLGISRNAAEVRIQWSSELIGWTLEYSSELAGPWSQSNLTPVLQGTTWSISIPASADAQFFRLK